MKKSITLLILIGLLVACSPSDKDVGAIVNNETIKHAIYESATVYAASTDYYFKEVNSGKAIQFRVSNLPDKKNIELPPDLLEILAEEGPPEANPNAIGKTFLLTYDEKKQLQKVTYPDDN